MNGNLPPGVSTSDPHFYPPDDAEGPACFCGHSRDEHDEEGLRCHADGCACREFDPDDYDDQEDPRYA